MPVFINDNARLYARDKAEIDAAIAAVLSSGRLDWGDNVPAFEAEFAAWCGARHAISVNSGSAALKVALLALDVEPGDEVITVPNTDIATSSAIRHIGAKPVWVDIDPVSRTMDTGALLAAITPRTAAIIPVDLFGHPANMPVIMQIAERHGLPVVEDACIALGAEIGGRKVGAFATVTCFSFAPNKHLGAYGSGGCALTDDASLADRMQKISAYGQDRSRHRAMHSLSGAGGLKHETDGLNERLDEIQAAILRVKLPKLAGTLATRRRQADLYQAALKDLPICAPATLPGYVHAWRNYVVESDQRDEIRAHLEQAGIATNLSYAPPMHFQPIYQDFGLGAGSFPVAERSCERLFGLPIGPHLDDDQIEQVIATLNSACR